MAANSGRVGRFRDVHVESRCLGGRFVFIECERGDRYRGSTRSVFFLLDGPQSLHELIATPAAHAYVGPMSDSTIAGFQVCHKTKPCSAEAACLTFAPRKSKNICVSARKSSLSSTIKILDPAKLGNSAVIMGVSEGRPKATQIRGALKLETKRKSVIELKMCRQDSFPGLKTGVSARTFKRMLTPCR